MSENLNSSNFFLQVMKIALFYERANGFTLILSDYAKKSKNVFKKILKKFDCLLFLYSADGRNESI